MKDPNGTAEFLNNLEKNVAKDQKVPVLGNKGGQVTPNASNSRGTNTQKRNRKLNADLDAAAQAILSEESSMG